MSLDCWQKSWESRVGGAKATSELGHYANPNADWTDEVHVFHLSDGTYAFVSESGCSCYTYDDANLELLPVAQAMEKYREFKKRNDGVFTNLELLEMKSIEKEEQANEPRCKNCNS
jgi:hypothetical protein